MSFWNFSLGARSLAPFVDAGLHRFFPSVLDYLDPDSLSLVDKELFTDLSRGVKKIMDIVALAESKGQQPNYSFLKMSLAAIPISMNDYFAISVLFFSSMVARFIRLLYFLMMLPKEKMPAIL